MKLCYDLLRVFIISEAWNPVTFLTFLFRRSRHHWLLLLPLVFGVVLATTVLASGPILIDALMEFGLRRTLLNANARYDILYLSARESADKDTYQSIDDQLDDFLSERLIHQDTNTIPAGHVGFMYPWQKGQMALDRRLTLGLATSMI